MDLRNTLLTSPVKFQDSVKQLKSELRNAYVVPLKPYELQSKNPFYNGTIVNEEEPSC